MKNLRTHVGANDANARAVLFRRTRDHGGFGVSVLLAFAAAVGCLPAPAVVPAAFCARCDTSNPLNRVLLPSFAAAHVEPHVAGGAEICARLAVDVLGRTMDAAEAHSTCDGADLDTVIVQMQGTEGYRVTSERHWADRFGLNDVITDWRYLKDLFDTVDALHAGTLRYDEFAIAAMASPALNLGDFDVRGRVRRIFRSFVGRAASQAEEIELGALFRPWLIGQEPDPDFPMITRNHAYILPGLCAPLARCSTTLFGGATLDFGAVADPFAPIYVEDLNAQQAAALRVPGALLVAQPFFAEAAADEMLNRYLDWDDGERSIRTPGFLFPQVRQVLADYLTETGDYPGAERMVLTSWLYTQTTAVGDGIDVAAADDYTALPSPLLVGPSKPLAAEVWLAAAAHLNSDDVGACDYRYGDGFPYFLLLNALGYTPAYSAAVTQLHALRDDRVPLVTLTGVSTLDLRFLNDARLLGGCPGFQAVRQRADGVSYALLQEGLATRFCDSATTARPAGAITARSVVQHQIPLLLGRDATDDDVAAIEAASACGAGCDDDELVNKTCISILGSAEFLFR